MNGKPYPPAPITQLCEKSEESSFDEPKSLWAFLKFIRNAYFFRDRYKNKATNNGGFILILFIVMIKRFIYLF